jgi:hypothetical protein
LGGLPPDAGGLWPPPLCGGLGAGAGAGAGAGLGDVACRALSKAWPFGLPRPVQASQPFAAL